MFNQEKCGRTTRTRPTCACGHDPGTIELPEGGVTPEGQIRTPDAIGGSVNLVDIRDARLEEARRISASMTLGSGGEHLLGRKAFEVDSPRWWPATCFLGGRASEERPDRQRYIQYRVRDIGVRLRHRRPGETCLVEPPTKRGSPCRSSRFARDTEENQFTEEEDLNARVDFSFPWLQGESGNRVQLGFRYRGKEKLRDNDFFEY